MLSRSMFLVASVVIIGFGFGIRLYNLGGDSFWIDELLTLQNALRGFPAVFTGARDHPPIIYILTSVAVQNFGESEFSARLFPMIAGTLSLPLMIAFGKVMGRPLTGLTAALLLAVSPFHLKYSQEARHYSALMCVSLATYIVLYLGMTRPKWKYWIGFGLLTAMNLYVHYGAFILLGSQMILISGWSVWQIKQHKIQRLLYPLLALFMTALLFLPWVPHFLDAMGANVGRSTISDTGGTAPLTDWLRESFSAFGMYYDRLPAVILLLAVMGLGILLWESSWLEFSFLLGGIVLPFLLIQLGQVARGSFPRYIIYVLPLYLFATAVPIATLLNQVSHSFGRRALVPTALTFGLLIAAVGWRPVRLEHDYVQDDWRGIVKYLNQHASDGDVLVMVSMAFANGFNTISSTLPYYLEKESSSNLNLLPGNRLSQSNVNQAKDSAGRIWVVLYDYRAPPDIFEDQAVGVKRFQNHLYVFEVPRQPGNTNLDRIMGLYEEIIPLAIDPSPRCLLQKDLAVLYTEAGDFVAAEEELNSALSSCPNNLEGFLHYNMDKDVLNVVFEGAATAYLEEGEANEAKRVAKELISLDPHNEVARDILTYQNLNVLFEHGEAEVHDEQSPESVRIVHFTMPDTGDWGEALLLHAPSSISFDLTLPPEAVVFSSRIAMDPQSWDWGGDGSTFVVTVTLANGDMVELYRATISNEVDDRRWHDVAISLADYAGQAVTLTLATETGPQGDPTGDWAGWETPRLIWAN